MVQRDAVEDDVIYKKGVLVFEGLTPLWSKYQLKIFKCIEFDALKIIILIPSDSTELK